MPKKKSCTKSNKIMNIDSKPKMKNTSTSSKITRCKKINTRLYSKINSKRTSNSMKNTMHRIKNTKVSRICTRITHRQKPSKFKQKNRSMTTCTKRCASRLKVSRNPDKKSRIAN